MKVKIFVVAMFAVLATTALRAQKLGVWTSVSNGAALAAAGGDFIEENAQKFLVPDKDEAAFDAMLAQAKASPVPMASCNMFLPGSMKLFGPQTVPRQTLLDWGEVLFRRADRASLKVVVFGCSGSRKIPNGMDRAQAERQFVELMSAYADMAAKYKIMLVLEPVNRKEVNFINTIADAVRIVRKVNKPYFRTMADFYHMAMNEEPASEIVKYKKYLYHFHVSEVKDRAPLGTYGDDLGAYFAAMRRIGFTGMISMESKFSDFDTQIGPAMAAFRNDVFESNIKK